MFWTVLRYELRYHLKKPVTYLYFAVLFLLAFFMVASEGLELVSATVAVTLAALCRCGASRRRPFCDGTHGRIGFEQ